MCLPVMKALRAAVPAYDLRIMALTTASAIAQCAGERPLGYRDFSGAPEAELALRYGGQLMLPQSHPSVSREESRAYLGFNFLEWVRDDGEFAAWQRWKEQGRHGFMPRRFMRYVLQQVRPDVVVTTNSPRSEEATVIAAASLGLPSVSMVDQFALPGDPFLVRRQYADCIPVLCEATRANLLAAGVPGSRIRVVGNPAFDAFSGDTFAQAGLAWRRGKGWQDLHIVLWAGDREADDAQPEWAGTALGQAVQAKLILWLEQHPQAGLILRYHPNEWQGFTQPVKHPRVHWSQPDRESLLPVLAASDDVVVQGSTTGIQAHVAGKRVICLRFSPFVRSSGVDFSTLGLATGVDRMDDLAVALDAGPGVVAKQRSKRSTSVKGPWVVSTTNAAPAIAEIIQGLADAQCTNKGHST